MVKLAFAVKWTLPTDEEFRAVVDAVEAEFNDLPRTQENLTVLLTEISSRVRSMIEVVTTADPSAIEAVE